MDTHEAFFSVLIIGFLGLIIKPLIIRQRAGLDDIRFLFYEVLALGPVNRRENWKF
jgi:hypothetical protein